MPEKLIEILIQLEKGLHWLGKYAHSQQVMELVKVLHESDIETVEDLRQRLADVEERSALREGAGG